MKRLALAALLFCICWPALGAGIALFAGTNPNTLFYVNSATGNDSNNGSIGSPWATIAHVNAQTFSANTEIFLSGTFADTLALTTTNAPSGSIIVTSYGSAPATISTDNTHACVTATNVPAVTLRGLICTGGGNSTNTTAGISIVNSQAGNTKLAGPTIASVMVSGYGGNCIEVKGTNGTSGFNGINFSGNISLHDCTGNSTASTGTACLNIFSATGYGTGATVPSHTNVNLKGITAFNCTGTTGSSSWTGSGIVVSEASGVVGQNLFVHDFGVNSTGGQACGIWTFDATGVHYFQMEVYHGLGTGSNGGCGVDLDGGVTNSIAEQFWSHDNNGQGGTLFTYNDGTISTQSNNTLRDFIVQNNCRNSNAGCGEVDIGASAGGTITNPQVLNWTCYAGVTGNCLGQTTTGTIAGTTALVANHIFYGVTGSNLVTVGHPGTLQLQGGDYFGSANFSWNGNAYTSYATFVSGAGVESVNGGHTFNPQIYVPGGGFGTGGYAPSQMMAYNPQAGSPVISAGINLQTQFGINPGTQDFFGNAVTAATLPIGAGAADFATFSPTCSQTATFLGLVSSFTKLDNVNYNSWICGSSFDGDLALMDMAYLLAAPNHAAMLLDVSGNGHTLTEHGTVTFTARTGIASNGSTGYEDTGWLPSSGPNYTLNLGTIAGYDLNNPGAQAFLVLLGAQTTAGTAESAIAPHANASSWYGDLNDESGTSPSASAATGFSLVQRTGASILSGYRNGGAAHTTTPAAVTIVNASMFLLAESNGSGSGVTCCWMTDTESLAFAGGGGISPLNTWLRAQSFNQGYGINPL